MTSPSSRPRRHAWARPLAARDRQEPERAATPLELFFDLCFVVAVASVSDRLHHAEIEAHVGEGVIAYVLVFFGIWWAWMNFTWFASAYDNDDTAYRLTTFVQIAGVLVLAAGVPRAFDEKDFSFAFIGYLIMRVGLVIQWLRAARGDPDGRRTAVRFAIGVSACMVGWAVVLVVPATVRLPAVVAMILAELSVPIWAERARNTPWHPRHIAERYGLFTLIVLGETVLASTIAVQRGLVGAAAKPAVLSVAFCGLVIVFGMWWIYFGQHAERFLRSNREGFRWGYGHYAIFSSAAAVGAGIAVMVDYVSHVGHLSARTAGAAVSIPVAVFVLCVWLLQVRPQSRQLAVDPGRAESHEPRGRIDLTQLSFPGAVILLLATAVTPWALPLTAVLVATLVVVTVVTETRAR